MCSNSCSFKKKELQGVCKKLQAIRALTKKKRQDFYVSTRCSSRRPRRASGSAFCLLDSWLPPLSTAGSVEFWSAGVWADLCSPWQNVHVGSEMGHRDINPVGRAPHSALVQTSWTCWNALKEQSTNKQTHFLELRGCCLLRWAVMLKWLFVL